MTSKIVPSQRGKGRVEYLSLAKEIERNILAGHTKRAIHDHLVTEGKITISYQRFCHYVKHYSPHCKPADRKILKSSPSPGVPAIRTVSAPPAPPTNSGDGSYSGQQENESSFSFKKEVTKEEIENELV